MAWIFCIKKLDFCKPVQVRSMTRGPAESWRDLFDYFNIDYFKIVLKFQVSQVDSALPTHKKVKEKLMHSLVTLW